MMRRDLESMQWFPRCSSIGWSRKGPLKGSGSAMMDTRCWALELCNCSRRGGLIFESLEVRTEEQEEQVRRVRSQGYPPSDPCRGSRSDSKDARVAYSLLGPKGKMPRSGISRASCGKHKDW